MFFFVIIIIKLKLYYLSFIFKQQYVCFVLLWVLCVVFFFVVVLDYACIIFLKMSSLSYSPYSSDSR